MAAIAADPTAAFGNAPAQLGGQALTPQQISQWANYFDSPNAGGGTGTQTTNQLVQTGTQYSPTIPWLTGGAGIGGIVSGQPGATGTNLNLPWGSLGIQSSADPQAMANNINASQYAGANPSDPYYSLILNQAGQGTQTPVYTQEQVPTAAPANNYAQVIGGQLIGNTTPEEQSLLGLFDMPANASYLLPNVLNAIAANPQGSLPGAQVGLAQQQLQMAGLPNLNTAGTPQSPIWQFSGG